MPNAADRLSAFVLEKSTEESIKRRIEIYRDLAEVLMDEEVGKGAIRLANELKELERQHRQLLLNLWSQK